MLKTWLSVAMLVGLTPPGMGLIPLSIDAVPTGRLPHPGIIIDGDAMLLLGPAVGVSNPTAEGTEDDPFVIAGWEIGLGPPLDQAAAVGAVLPYASVTARPAAVGGILIENTTAHIIIRDCWIHNFTAKPLFEARVALPTQPPVSAGPLAVTPLDHAGAITLFNASNVRLVQNVVTQNDASPLRIEAVRGVFVEGNAFANNSQPIVVTNSTNIELASNGIREGGLVVAGATDVVALGNVFVGRTSTTPISVRVSGSTNVEVLGNRFQQVSPAYFAPAGVAVRSSAKTYIGGNSFERPWDAVSVDAASSASAIVANVVHGAAGYGISDGGTRSIIRSNTLEDTSGTPLAMWGFEGAAVSNSIRNYSSVGISVVGTTGSVLDGNRVTGRLDVPTTGLYLGESSGARLTWNVVGQNHVGVWIASASMASLERNVLADNRAEGFLVVGTSDRNLFEGNTIRNTSMNAGSDGVGLVLSGQASNNTVFGNHFEANSIGMAVGRGARDNIIYNNDFANRFNAIDSSDGPNRWNATRQDGIPGVNIVGTHVMGGNHWSDYSGVDANHDGFGDVPYDVGHEALDALPLVAP